MCDMCLKHGANGKWFMNSRNYLKETIEEADSLDYLEELWGNLEKSYTRKVYKIMNMKGASRNINIPLIGRLIKWYANNGFIKDGTKKKIKRKATQGHFGQVISLEESKAILIEMAPVIAKANCPCKYFKRGITEATCLGFTALNETLPKLPRFIPENGVEILDAEQAGQFLDEQSKKGRVNTLWCGPLPAIAALCSCDEPSCGGLNLLQFGLRTCWKGHFVAQLNLDNCTQCGNCRDRCQFHALTFLPGIGPQISNELCYGCGKCSEVCEAQAIQLFDRDQIPETRGKY